MELDDNALSRRRVLHAAASGSTVAIAGCIGGSGNNESNQQSMAPIDVKSIPPNNTGNNVNVWNWYNSWIDQATKEFKSEHDVNVSTATYSNPSEWYSKLEANAGEIDSVSATNSWVVRSMKNDYLYELPVKRMQGWKKLTDNARKDAEQYYQQDGSTYAIPEALIGQCLTYSTKYFDKDPGSWDVLWDSDLKGKVSMQDWSEVACRVAALYTGQDPNDPDDFKEIKEVLIQQKDLNNTYWQDHSRVLQMFKNDEIVATVYTDARTFDGRFNRNIDMGLSKPKEGFMYTYDNYVMPKGAPNPKAGLLWTDWASRPKNAAEHVLTQGAIAPVKNLNNILSDELSDDALKFLKWPQRMSNKTKFIEPLSNDLRKRYDEIWSSVKSA